MAHSFISSNFRIIFFFLMLSSCCFSQLNERNAAVKHPKTSDSISISNEKFVTTDVNVLMNEERQRLEAYRTKVHYLLLFLFVGFLVKAYFMYRYYKKMKRQREKILHDNNNLYQTKQENKELHLKINSAFDEVVQLAKENNPEFLMRFQEVYPHCYNKLIKLYPGLQTSELKFCAMLYLNFSSKDIAEFTFVTPKAVQNRKNRLRKKLNISSDEDFNLWMKKICG